MIRPLVLTAVLALAPMTPSPANAQEYRLTTGPEPAESENSDATDAGRLRKLAAKSDPASLAEAARLASALRARQLEAACLDLYVPDKAKPGRASIWAMSTKRAGCVWGTEGITGLDQASVTAGGETGAIYTDLLTTYFGPLRANLGTMVSATGTTDGEDENANQVVDAREAIQRLVSGGGNIVLGVQIPMIRWHAPSVNGFDFIVAGLARGATDVEALGAEAQSATRSLAAAIDGRVQIMSNDQQLQLFAYGKVEGVWGAEPLFPGFSATPGAAQVGDGPKHFQYGRVSLGAFLWKVVRVTYTTYPWCNACGDTGISGQATVALQRQLGGK